MVILTFISLAAGLVVGILAGLVGIGGGTILVPVFTVCFGMAPLMATGTSLFTIVFTSLAGTLMRVRNHTCKVKMGALLGLGGALTSPVGAYAATRSPEIVVVIAVALVIVYSALTTLRKALQAPTAATGAATGKTTMAKTSAESALNASRSKDPTPEAALPSASASTPVSVPESTSVSTLDPASTAAPAPPAPTSTCTPASALNSAPAPAPTCASAPAPHSTQVSISGLKCLGIGLVTGLVSGYVGLGGGFLMVPLMCNFLGSSMKEASGTSLLAIILIAASGAAAQYASGNVDVWIGLFVACGSIPGAIIGSLLVTRFNDRMLRFVFSGFLLVAAGLLIAQQTGVLG